MREFSTWAVEVGIFGETDLSVVVRNMIKVETTPSIQSLVAEMRQLSEDEQRALAGAVLHDNKLEAFVEELDDHLTCERAEAEGSAELFTT